MKFAEFNLSENLMKGIEEAGFTDCLPVQESTYQYSLQGRDVMVQSQTGSGKTAAFLISIFELFSRETNTNPKRALIIAPTRELAVQIEDEAKILGAHLPFRTGCFYGGVGYDRQESLLNKGVDIVIGTPGRLIDLNQSRKLDLSDIGVLVIDEADRLFDMGFLPDLRRILRTMPDSSRRQTMLFSATLSYRVQELAAEHMNDAAQVDIAPESVTVETVEQMVYHVSLEEKMKLLLGLLKKEKPETALIFTNMKTRAIEVARRLESNGFGCEYIIGDLPQKKRLDIINSIKAGKIRILVATDVAARGLHINNLDLVVNYDLPEDPESYVHRIGRTARVGKAGKAITLVCERYVYSLEAIETLINIKIPVARAQEEDYAEDKTAGRRIRDERPGRGREHDRRPSGKPAHAGRQGRPDREGRPGRPAHDERPARAEKPEHPKKPLPGREKAPREAAESRAKKEEKKAPRAAHPAGQAKPQARDLRRSEEKTEKKKSGPRHQTQEERMAYYRKKYGEDFNAPAAPSAPAQKKKKGRKLLDAIKGIFSKKKSSKKA